MNFKKNIKERMCLYMIINDKKIMFCSEKELEFVNAGLFDGPVLEEMTVKFSDINKQSK